MVNQKNLLSVEFFLKKYLTIFNADKKTIYFYKNKQISQINNNNESEANKSFFEEWWIIILIVFIVCLILFLILGIIIGRILYKNRNMHKNELDDNYEYQADNKNDALNDNDKGIN
jgi:flagellar biosynthesis/type III secretory pathway M-ring protein FliF/YscJ